LSTCTAARQPSPCNCLCPTCLPEEWPHRKKPPLCTTPAPPPGPPKTEAPPPPPTAPPPPPLAPLKMLPPYTVDHLPTIGPFPATVLPTTTTGFFNPPAGKCIDDGFYRTTDRKYLYEKIGKGLCIDEGRAAISYKKRRELTSLNFECICKEACDSEPGCIGYSTNDKNDGNGLACRVYGGPGKEFPTLVDRWLDLGSMKSPMYKGEKIVAANGERGHTCYMRKPAPGPGPAPAPAAGDFMQMEQSMPVPPPQISFVERQTSTAELLEWQRKQLANCREQQGSLVSLLEQRGCKAAQSSVLRRLGRGSARDLVMPNECECHCPDCNFWQLPPPLCHEPTPPPTATVPPLPSGVIVITPPPRAPTPPPMPVQIPLPPLPPIGNQFLPTLGPWPPPEPDM